MIEWIYPVGKPLAVKVLLTLVAGATPYFLSNSRFINSTPLLITAVLLIFNLSAQYCKSCISSVVSLISKRSVFLLAVGRPVRGNSHHLTFVCRNSIIYFCQTKDGVFSTEFNNKYEEILLPKSQTDHIPKNDIHNAFREQYIVTLEQKGLATIALKHNGTKLPVSNKDVNITDYGSLLVDAIYDEDFFGKIKEME